MDLEGTGLCLFELLSQQLLRGTDGGRQESQYSRRLGRGSKKALLDEKFRALPLH